jgi:hypothetical protein
MQQLQEKKRHAAKAEKDRLATTQKRAAQRKRERE